MKNVYVIYNSASDSFYYNTRGGHSSFTKNVKYSNMSTAIYQIFHICCVLYEREHLNLNHLVVVEIREEDDGEILVDFTYPIWIGNVDKMILLWENVEDKHKEILLKMLWHGNLPKMHKVVESWYYRDLGYVT